MQEYMDVHALFFSILSVHFQSKSKVDLSAFNRHFAFLCEEHFFCNALWNSYRGYA